MASAENYRSTDQLQRSSGQTEVMQHQLGVGQPASVPGQAAFPISPSMSDHCIPLHSVLNCPAVAVSNSAIMSMSIQGGRAVGAARVIISAGTSRPAGLRLGWRVVLSLAGRHFFVQHGLGRIGGVSGCVPGA